MSAQPQLLLTVAQTAAALAIGETLCRQLIRSGVIPSIRLGRALRVPVSALEEIASLSRAEESRPQAAKRPAKTFLAPRRPPPGHVPLRLNPGRRRSR